VSKVFRYYQIELYDTATKERFYETTLLSRKQMQELILDLCDSFSTDTFYAKIIPVNKNQKVWWIPNTAEENIIYVEGEEKDV
jgi:hypothetical protein